MTRHPIAAFVLALSLAGPALAGPQQFNLVCTGTTQTTTNGEKTPYSVTYQVDLAAMQYCRPNCAAIEQVAPDKIVFEDREFSPLKKALGETEGLHIVSRTDGKLFELWWGGGALLVKHEGHCDVAPFTGFPKAQF